MFNSVPSNGLSVRDTAGEASAQPLTIHTPQQAHGQRDMAIQEVACSPLSDTASQFINSFASRFITSFPSIGKALRCAAENGYINIVNIILEQGVNKEDMNGALISATEQENEEIVNALFKAGADKWLANTVLVQAVIKKNIKIMNIAFELGVDQKYIDQAFVKAVEVGERFFTKRKSIEEIEKAQIDMVNIFLRAGVSKEFIGKALVEAAKEDNLEIVNILLDAGVSKEYVGKAFVEAVTMGCRLETILFYNNNPYHYYLNSKKQSREILNNLLKVIKSQPSLDRYVGEALVVAKRQQHGEEMAQFILDAGYRDNMFVIGEALQESEEQANAQFINHEFSNVLKAVFLPPLPPVKDSQD